MESASNEDWLYRVVFTRMVLETVHVWINILAPPYVIYGKLVNVSVSR